MAVEVAVPGGKGNLAGLDPGEGFGHQHLIIIERSIRVKGQHGGDALGDADRLEHADPAVCQLHGLFRRHDDVFVVGEDKNGLGGGGMDRTEDVVGAGIHGLAAGDYVVDA